jgi:hypothetical protein
MSACPFDGDDVLLHAAFDDAVVDGFGASGFAGDHLVVRRELVVSESFRRARQFRHRETHRLVFHAVEG